MKQRNLAETITCQWCKNEISSYGLSNHIKYLHRDKTVDEYVSEFGEFRKNKLKKEIPPKRKTINVVCEICNKTCATVGMSNHLRDSHGLTTEQYLNLGHAEFRPKYIDYNKRSKENDFKCLICNESNFASHQHFAHHVVKEHNLKITDYAQIYIFNNEIQLCKCGCGKPVSLSPRPPYKLTYVSGHNENPMLGKRHKTESKVKMRDKSIERGLSNVKLTDTKPELEFKAFLNENNIDFIPQHPTKYGIIDFYLPDFEMYVEIDGTYWHPTKIEFLNIQLINSCISQHNKRYAKNLYRIRSNDVKHIKTIEDIVKFNFQYDYDIQYKQIIISKDYFNEHTNEVKLTFIPILIKFLKTYCPQFPPIPATENLQTVIEKIGKYDLSKINKDNIFYNNISNLGVSYLKSEFLSYWKSSYKNKKSPFDVWNDDYILHDIIKYRIGINNSNEVFDFTLHQMIRGISANRYTVSFFKPLLAAAIYKHFLKDIEAPVVFDPCCGFGGRLVGFKSAYPNGKYIGCEPNIETFNELFKLSKHFTNVEIYNCKVEDFNLSENVDLSFTSIPYFDLETYSNPVEYESMTEWTNIFLTKIKSLPRLVVNIPNSLRNEFDANATEYFIQSNTSHFDKKNTVKTEYLLSFLKQQ
jgi:G:T-mismatch repair DNA endonuclease (very short patch repair protein)